MLLFSFLRIHGKPTRKLFCHFDLTKSDHIRAIEDVLKHLVEWAAAALEKASIQPVLPHVIIALNASKNSIDETLWDPKVATLAVLDSISRTVNRNNTFKNMPNSVESATARLIL